MFLNQMHVANRMVGPLGSGRARAAHHISRLLDVPQATPATSRGWIV